MVNLSDIEAAVSCVDQDNVGGTARKLIFGYWDDVASFPDFPDCSESSPITLDAAGKLDGDLTMKTGKRAYVMDFTDETGEFTMTEQGEQGGLSVLMQLDIVRAKINTVILGFMNATRGRDMFFIVQDRNGYHYLMGDKVVAAKRVAADAVTTGKAAADLNKVPMRFTYTCPRALIYEGDVTNILTEAKASVGPSV